MHIQVEQRDLYDRAPQLNWAAGHVCLLGDAAHPMMPNLGQASDSHPSFHRHQAITRIIRSFTARLIRCRCLASRAVAWRSRTLSSSAASSRASGGGGSSYQSRSNGTTTRDTTTTTAHAGRAVPSRTAAAAIRRTGRHVSRAQVQQEQGAARSGGAGHVAAVVRDPLSVQPPR